MHAQWAVTGPAHTLLSMPFVRSGLQQVATLSKQDADLFSILIGRIGYGADVNRIERVGVLIKTEPGRPFDSRPDEIIWAQHNSGAHDDGSADTRLATKWRDLDAKYAPRAGFDIAHSQFAEESHPTRAKALTGFRIALSSVSRCAGLFNPFHTTERV